MVEGGLGTLVAVETVGPGWGGEALARKGARKVAVVGALGLGRWWGECCSLMR